MFCGPKLFDVVKVNKSPIPHLLSGALQLGEVQRDGTFIKVFESHSASGSELSSADCNITI